jgi:formamidopyrimidine-DNA glycosylase
LTGRKIVKAERLDAPPGPKYANLEWAKGRRIEAVERRGKFLILPLDGEFELIIHLGMTGIITAEKPERHARARLLLNGGEPRQLYFRDTRRFGRFLVVPAGDYRTLPTLHGIGPEPLSEAFTEAHFRQALQRSSTPIKTYLLSQKPVAGVGNIYADEALWSSKIHPLTPAKQVPTSRVAALRKAIRRVLYASIEAQGTTLNDYRTVNGEVGTYLSELNAYGHEGDPCPECGAPISKRVVGGRGTYYCPDCQRPDGRQSSSVRKPTRFESSGR